MANMSLINKAIVLMVFISIVYPCPGECACTIPAWVLMAGNNSQLVPIFRGTIGDGAVRGVLRYDNEKKEFFGEFSGNEKSHIKKVYGYMDTSKLSSPMVLSAYGDDQSNITGHFYLKFRDPGFWINDKNQKVPYGDDCSQMDGEWVSLDNNVVKKVVLGIDGEISFPPTDVAKRNEEVASKVREALLENNRRAFAGLLDYPFHVYLGNGGSLVLNSPKDVVRHFAEVAIFSKSGIFKSVPRYLHSYASISTLDVDSGDIVIDSGKVRRICITRHPMYCPLTDGP